MAISSGPFFFWISNTSFLFIGASLSTTLAINPTKKWKLSSIVSSLLLSLLIDYLLTFVFGINKGATSLPCSKSSSREPPLKQPANLPLFLRLLLLPPPRRLLVRLRSRPCHFRQPSKPSRSHSRSPNLPQCPLPSRSLHPPRSRRNPFHLQHRGLPSQFRRQDRVKAISSKERARCHRCHPPATDLASPP